MKDVKDRIKAMLRDLVSLFSLDDKHKLNSKRHTRLLFESLIKMTAAYTHEVVGFGNPLSISNVHSVNLSYTSDQNSTNFRKFQFHVLLFSTCQP